MTFTLGALRLSSAVLLAPMSGVTDRPFRQMVRRFGVGLAFSEMISSGLMLAAARGQGSAKAAPRMTTRLDDDFPLAVQITGSEPAAMAKAAQLNAARGATLIDLNFGCPARKIAGKQQAGAALMRDLTAAARLFEAVVAAVSIPVTVKMRLGWDEDERNAVALARLAEACGLAMVTVHGRTRNQFYQGQADWAAIGEVKAAVSIPVVANGDIDGPEAAQRCLALSQADGVMVGRATCGRPWLPAQIARFLADGTLLPDPDPVAQAALVLEHYDAILAHYGAFQGVRIARKHLSWYLRDRPHAAALRAEINALEDPEAVRACLRRELAPAPAAAPGQGQGGKAFPGERPGDSGSAWPRPWTDPGYPGTMAQSSVPSEPPKQVEDRQVW